MAESVFHFVTKAKIANIAPDTNILNLPKELLFTIPSMRLTDAQTKAKMSILLRFV